MKCGGGGCVIAAEEVEADVAVVVFGFDGLIEGAGIKGMVAGDGREETGVVGTGGDAAGKDGLQHGRVIGSFGGPRGADAGDGRFLDRAHERGHLRIGHGAVVAGGFVGGEKPDKRPGQGETLLKGDDVGHGVRLSGTRGGESAEVEIADQIEGHALPAGGREGGGVARVAEAGFVADGEKNIGAQDEQEDQPREKKRQKNHDLPGSVRLFHQSIQSG